jgi:hypothetical protein
LSCSNEENGRENDEDNRIDDDILVNDISIGIMTFCDFGENWREDEDDE